MTLANRETQSYNTHPNNVVQSLLFNNRYRVIEYRTRDAQGNWQNRADLPAPVVRLYETEAAPERTCLETIQFVHHMLIPPGGRHVAELHIHPDAEEIVVVTCGQGTAIVDSRAFSITAGDVVHVPTAAEHEFRNDSQEQLGVLFINVPTGAGLEKLKAAQSS